MLLVFCHCCCSVTKLCLTLWLHGLQHTRLLCPSLSAGVCSNACALSQWCHPTISTSVITFSCPPSFPASGSFPVSQLFASGGQSIGAWASALVLQVYIQGWFPLELTGGISLLSKGPSKIFSSITVQNNQFFTVEELNVPCRRGDTIPFQISLGSQCWTSASDTPSLGPVSDLPWVQNRGEFNSNRLIESKVVFIMTTCWKF